jgi:hypothetical protein
MRLNCGWKEIVSRGLKPKFWLIGMSRLKPGPISGARVTAKQGQTQIPCGNDNKKGKARATADPYGITAKCAMVLKNSEMF